MRYVRASKPSSLALVTAVLFGTACQAALQAPTIISLSPVSGTSNLALTWSDPNKSSTSTAIERSTDGISFVQVGTVGVGVKTFQNAVVACGARYYYRVRALGNGNNVSPYSAVVSTLAPDIVPPTQPAATASAASCSQINLSWTAASDTCGVTAYLVYRNGTLLKQLPNTTTATTDTGLAASTTYSYSVSARDAAGNVSSAVASAKTFTCGTTTSTTTTLAAASTTTTTTLPPIGPPPSSLGATVNTCTQVTLGWTAPGASTCGLKGYNIYRNNAFVKQVVGSPTTDTVGASTLDSYQVSAVYNSCRESGRSNTASVNTPACPPPPGGTGAFRWQRQLTSTSFDAGYAVATDRNGNTFVTGYAGGTMDFGGGPLADAGLGDAFVAKYNASGVYLWAKRLGGTAQDFGEGIAVDGNGDVIVTGEFQNTVNFGGGPLTSTGGRDIFIAKYSGATGAHLWSRRYGSYYDDEATAVAVDASNNVVITGQFQGGLTPAIYRSNRNNFVIKLSSAGAEAWVTMLPGNTDNRGEQIAVDGSGNVIVEGGFLGSLTCGSTTLQDPASMATAIFMAKLSPTGTVSWCKSLGEPTFGGPYTGGLVADGSGNIYIAGQFRGTVDFGTGPVTSNWADAFVAKYGPTGAAAWVRVYGGGTNDGARGLALDGSGNVTVVGLFGGTVDFGAGAMTAVSGQQDLFVAKYTPTGSALWSKHYANAIAYPSKPIASDPSGNLVLTGYFSGTTNFGGPSLTAGSTDLWLLSLAP